MHDETTIEAVRWRMVRELEKARDAAETNLDRATELHERAQQSIRETNRREVAHWARSVLDDPFAVLLALGTTGLEDPVDVVEVVVLGVGVAGEPIYSMRVRPAGYAATDTLCGDDVEVRRGPVEVEEGAFRVHGHADPSLRDARTLEEIWPGLHPILALNRVVAYNAEYVSRVLSQSTARYGLEPLTDAAIECAMERYARVEGRWSVEDETYRPVALPGRDGSAGGNARALYHLLRTLAGRVPVPSSSGGRGGRRREEVDVDEEDFEDVPFRALHPIRVRYPLIF